MAKRLFWILLVFLTLAGSAMAGFEVVAVRAPRGMNIDGDLSEWAHAKPVVFRGTEYLVAPGTDPWSGTSDLSGEIYFMYDDDYLYIAAKITDNVVLQPFSGAHIFQGDGIQVMLALDGGHKGRSSYSRMDYQFGFTPGTNAASPSWHLWNNSKRPNDVLLEATKTENGYILEIAISWWDLDVFADPGMELGLDVGITDTDRNGATQNYYMRSGYGDGWSTPSRFGWLVLGD